MKTYLKPLLLIMMLLISNSILLAQADQDDDIEDVPINTEVEILIAVAGVYGLIKQRDKVSKSKHQ